MRESIDVFSIHKQIMDDYKHFVGSFINIKDKKIKEIVALAMYDDHMEITNPGGHHFGITPEKLAKPHESKPWNPIIANVFYRAGIIERWCTGTLNIVDWCKENGNPEPTWQEQAGSVYVKFLPAVLPDTPKDTGNVGTKLGLSRDQVQGPSS